MCDTLFLNSCKTRERGIRGEIEENMSTVPKPAIAGCATPRELKANMEYVVSPHLSKVIEVIVHQCYQSYLSRREKLNISKCQP